MQITLLKDSKQSNFNVFLTKKANTMGHNRFNIMHFAHINI